MASPTLVEISRSDLKETYTPQATITEVRHLTSYSWLEKSVPTISVPGLPPLWSPPSRPMKLAPDSGMVYIDQNAARSPRSPIEPLFRALYSQHPGFEIDDIDLVTDRNNMRKLLRFVQASSAEPFKVRIEIAGDHTAIFTRAETKTNERIEGFKGFGHNFERAYTKRQSEHTGHHRIVSYRLADIKCIIRHETDGYLGDTSQPSATPRTANAAEGLVDSLGALSISTHDGSANNLRVTVVKSDDQIVDISSTLEIKTRAASRKLDLTDVTPQLWMSQTPNLVVAYHQGGIFNNVQLRNVKQSIQDWEATNQRTLSELVSLIKRVVASVQQSDHRVAAIEYSGGSTIKVTTGGQERALPDDLYTHWSMKKQGESATCTLHDPSQETTMPCEKPPGPLIKPYQSVKNTNQDTNLQSSGKTIASSSTHEDISLSQIIEFGVRKGFRQYFRRLPTDLLSYRRLCESLQYGMVDVLGGRNLRGILNDMRRGKEEWDPEERRHTAVRSLARDSAFRLLYILILGEPLSEVQNKAMVYNVVFFVVSHRRIFRYRTRKMVREAFEARFQPSYKQLKELEKWPIQGTEEEEEDVTTEEEDYFDSDWSF